MDSLLDLDRVLESDLRIDAKTVLENVAWGLHFVCHLRKKPKDAWSEFERTRYPKVVGFLAKSGIKVDDTD